MGLMKWLALKELESGFKVIEICAPQLIAFLKKKLNVIVQPQIEDETAVCMSLSMCT